MSIIFNNEENKINLFHLYALRGHYDTYKQLKENISVDEYLLLSSQPDNFGNYCLFYAFLGGNKNIIDELLTYNGYLNTSDKKNNIYWYENEDILSFILHNKNIDIFKYYIFSINKCNINIPNIIYNLIHLYKGNHISDYYNFFIKELNINNIEYDINPYEKNKKGENLFYYCILNNNEYILKQLLLHAFSNKNYNNTNPFDFLLFNLPYYTLSEKFRFNSNRAKFIHHLIELYGIDFINKENNNSKTLSNLAIEFYDEELLRLLISHNVDPLEKDNLGNTCLHICVKNGSIYSYKILRDYFSPTTIFMKNNKGQTLYDIANSYFQSELYFRFKELLKNKKRKMIHN